MFSGIVQDIGQLIKASGHEQRRLIVQTQLAKKCRLGDSVAVNGVCLTVDHIENNLLSFDVIPETCRRTNLKQVKADDPLNIELSLTLNDYIGGHLMQGHVDCCAEISRIETEEQSKLLTFSITPHYGKLLINKGFISVDGMSLTLIETGDDFFTLSIIPHTLAHTITKHYQVGSTVNIEIDMMAKYINNYMQRLHHD